MADNIFGSYESDEDARDFRPIIDRPAEVLRAKKTTQSMLVEDPPTFGGPKIGGAASLVSRYSTGVEDGKSSREFNMNKLDDARLEQGNVSSVSSSNGGHPFTAPPGWRRYWAPMTSGQSWEWSGNAKVSFSQFCKACYDEKQPCEWTFPCEGSSDSWSCHRCSSGKECLRLISYKPHPLEDTSPEYIKDAQVRIHATAWSQSVGTPLEVPSQAAPIRWGKGTNDEEDRDVYAAVSWRV